MADYIWESGDISNFGESGSRFKDGGTYRLQNNYVYYKLESKATSNFYVTSKKLGHFEKKLL